MTPRSIVTYPLVNPGDLSEAGCVEGGCDLAPCWRKNREGEVLETCEYLSFHPCHTTPGGQSMCGRCHD